MPPRPVLALAAATLLSLPGPHASADPARAELVSTYVWPRADRARGGWSAIEMDADGRTFTIVTDDGYLADGTLVRDGDNIVGVEVVQTAKLVGDDGAPVEGPFDDSEGLAVMPDGSAWVSFEGEGRVRQIRGAPSLRVPDPLDFAGLQTNSGLEALAVDADGSLYAIPERSGDLQRNFPVYRLKDGRWTVPFTIPRRGNFLPVGADIGPDGRLYLLERAFQGIFGFRSRIRRFDVAIDGLSGEAELITTGSGDFDNLEGLSAWRDDAAAIRLTAISDDNNFPFQRTEIVEFRVLDPLAPSATGR